MANIRVLWDEHESAILMDYFMRYKNGEITKTVAITNVSKELRERAKRKEIKIDDVFRNVNGITMQMSKIEDLYTGQPTRLSKASHVFESIVDKYLNDRPSFDRILKEAREVKNDTVSVQEQFFKWLSYKASPAQMSELFFTYSEIESFCVGRKILKRPLFETTSVQTIALVKSVVDSNKVFRFTHKKKTRKMQVAIQYYYNFVKDYQSVQQTHEPTSDSVSKTVEIVAPVSVVIEKKPRVVDAPTVSFNALGSYAFTKSENLSSFGDAGWQTNDNRNKRAELALTVPTVSASVPASSDSKSFFHWMVNEHSMTTSSGYSYASGIIDCEHMAIQLGLESTCLYGVGFEEAYRTTELLMKTSSFKVANDSQHNRLQDSLSKYLQYLSGNTSFSLSKMASVSVPQSKPTEDLLIYDRVLQENFPKGYRVESNLDLKRFIRYYNIVSGMDLDVKDEQVRSRTKQNILSVGIRHGDYIFSAEGVVSSATKEHLVSYIERSFSKRKRVIYYKALFEEFNDEFLGQRIYDEDMLRTYLVHECGEDYVFERRFMSQERNVQIDPKDEIREILVAYGAPMKTEKLYEQLPNLPTDRIDWAIHTNKEFVCNTWGEYFYISLIDLSDDELEDIADLIEQIIKERHFLSGNELIHAICRKYPDMLERFPQFSQLGLRDSIAYYLGDRFSFNGNIISPLHKQLSMNDVFAEFARTHHSFTIDELNVLKKEMNSTIYFDSIYANSLRVSQHQFVSKEEADFDVINTDKAISLFCIGDYLPLAGVTSFGSFPYAGFPWSIYLLEHYVADYSHEYKLLHTSFNADNCVGAIVKKSSGIESFNSLITEVLAHCDVDLNKKDALQYLCEMGYLARRRFSDIDQILIKARAKKG